MNSSVNSAESPLPQSLEVVPRVTVDWYRSIPWWRLLSQSVSIGWRASHLMLAGLAMWVTLFGWQLGEWAFAPEGIESLPLSTVVDRMPAMVGRVGSWIESASHSKAGFDWMTLRRTAYWLFGILWTIGVWSFAGGLLARRSLMEMGIRSSVGWGPSCRLVCRRWLSMVWGISMPLAAIFGLALFPFALGIIARMGVIGQGMALLLMLPAMFLAIGIGWCAAITGLGFPLSICAITAEKNADAFDGISRSAAYVFQRPMTFLMILILACGLGWLGDWVIQIVLGCGEKVVWSAFSIGLGGDIQERLPSEQRPFLSFLLGLSESVVPTLRTAFLCSFFWSAAAAAYLTLRWEIDHTDFDELDLQELGEPVAMPPFTHDSRNVAEIGESSE